MCYICRIELRLKMNEMKEFNTKKKIEDVGDFEEYCIEILESYLDTFTKDAGLIRDVEEDDLTYEDEISFIYTLEGERLAKKMIGLLHKIGEAHYPSEDIEISTSKFQEI